MSILSSSSAEKETEVKLGRPLRLCESFGLCPSELAAFEQFLHLLEIDFLPFLDYSTPAKGSFTDSLMLYLPQ